MVFFAAMLLTRSVTLGKSTDAMGLGSFTLEMDRQSLCASAPPHCPHDGHL